MHTGTEAPTRFTLAARIAEEPLTRLLGSQFGPANLDAWRAEADRVLDHALDCATFAIWEHTNTHDAAAELLAEAS